MNFSYENPSLPNGNLMASGFRSINMLTRDDLNKRYEFSGWAINLVSKHDKNPMPQPVQGSGTFIEFDYVIKSYITMRFKTYDGIVNLIKKNDYPSYVRSINKGGRRTCKGRNRRGRNRRTHRK
jgi:hypothetical protein